MSKLLAELLHEDFNFASPGVTGFQSVQSLIWVLQLRLEGPLQTPRSPCPAGSGTAGDGVGPV